jgi:hypothetical protein
MNSGLTIKYLLLALLAAVAMAPEAASGCAVCYGDSNSPLAIGLNWGIASLLAVVLLVLGSVGGFFFYIAKRSANSGLGAGPVDSGSTSTNH